MHTPCWLKYLCFIRAWVPFPSFLPFFLPSFLSLSRSLFISLSLFLANSLERGSLLSSLSCPGFWDPLEKAHCAFTHLRGCPVPTCSSVSSKNRAFLAFCTNQGISASFSLLLSYRWLWTTRFRSIKGPTFDLLAIQGTLKSLLQHYSSKASFFSAQLSL